MNTLARVAIVGSPNVGKSTLFNRLIRQRRAITDSTPGVTRDPVESSFDLAGRRLMLTDTGGYRESAEDGLEEEVRRLSLEAGSGAAVILLIVDVNGLSTDDEHFIEKMRQYESKVILVVNKVDNEKRDALVWNYHQVGFERVVGISAAHGRNMEALEREIVGVLGESRGEEGADPEPTVRIAILGKPNTGKSTLSNHLLEEEKSLVSEKPGTTRDVIEGVFSYRGELFQVLDTAGIRRKGKVTDSVEYYSVNRAIRSISRCDVVFLLIDAATGLTDQDKKISSQVIKEGRGIVLVLNKWDLLKDIPNRLQAMKDRIAFQFPILDFAPIVPLSALTGEGVRALLDMGLRVVKQLQQRIKTPLLNRELKVWLNDHPAQVKGRTVAIRYAVQVSTYPTLFLFFADRIRGIPRTYERYLANRIRKAFHLELIPIRVELREKKK